MSSSGPAGATAPARPSHRCPRCSQTPGASAASARGWQIKSRCSGEHESMSSCCAAARSRGSTRYSSSGEVVGSPSDSACMRALVSSDTSTTWACVFCVRDTQRATIVWSLVWTWSASRLSRARHVQDVQSGQLTRPTWSAPGVATAALRSPQCTFAPAPKQGASGSHLLPLCRLVRFVARGWVPLWCTASCFLRS